MSASLRNGSSRVGKYDSSPRPVELSVIVPCFNGEATIATQLEALAAQTWPHAWEVIVSDNGSTDRSIEIVSSYQQRMPNLRVVDSGARRRHSYACNFAAKCSSAKYLAFCDADDEVAPGWVAGMGNALAEHEVVTGLICGDKFNDLKQAEGLAALWKEGLYWGQFLPKACSCILGIRHSVHNAIGGYDEALPRYADADYSWKILLAGYKIHYDPSIKVQYRIARANLALSYLFRRGWTAPAADHWQYKKYRFLGVSKDAIINSRYLRLRTPLGASLRLIRRLPESLRESGLRAKWLQEFSLQSGELCGHVLGRLLNPCEPFPVEKVRIELPVSSAATAG